MATALTDLSTEALHKQASTFGTILKIVAIVFVAFVLTMSWLLITRGWHTQFLFSLTPAIAMIAVSAPAMSRLASIKLELERRAGTTAGR
jgi:magnesium-transporting ATPase (P-type)